MKPDHEPTPHPAEGGDSGAGTWHTNQFAGGAPYPTRHYTHVDCGDHGSRYLELPAESLQIIRAIHEAAHAVIALAGGAHLHHTKIDKPGSPGDTAGATGICGLTDSQSVAAYCAAGERADDRWLRDNGLWTARRAVCVEIGARADRQTLLALNSHVGFGDTDIHYQAVHDLADRLIDQHWDQITTLAGHLVERLYLDGSDVATLTEIDGPACTCGRSAARRQARRPWRCWIPAPRPATRWHRR
ncbi:hypothetical protein OHB41_49725 [Streptomyces sp. NBC_01571]|uniref:hypothetical protein n=1 Tax=Streptomyces sp. NBC_01571 TaxID=2975883 RepID=UPI00224D0FE6|nr:hypothetical protein [Streptomyces sp. NBC_01571]MCX4581043.1 hypothetical protein [Streptomyces sp. NBC_01571]